MKKRNFLVTIILTLIYLLSCINYASGNNNEIQKGNPITTLNEKPRKTGQEDNSAEAKRCVAKAKKEKDYMQVVKGFRELMFLDIHENYLKYADSIIYYAKLTNDRNTIGNAYLSKGIVYYKQKELAKALKNYITADEYISQTNDAYAKFKMKYVIAQAKYYLGFYDEALALLTECKLYFETENDQAYVSTLHLLALCHSKMHNYELSEKYVTLGLAESTYLELAEMHVFFMEVKAINNFYLQKYSLALAQLKVLALDLKQKDDKTNFIQTHFYIAKCYWKLNQKQNALPYLLQVTAAFSNQNFMELDFRDTYEMLIQYYNESGETEAEMKHIKDLMKWDIIIAIKYVYLSKTMHKEYDTKKLIKLIQVYEKHLRKSDQTSYIIYAALSCTTIIIFMLVYRNLYSRKKYIKKFDELMAADDKSFKKSNGTRTDVDITDIKDEIVKVALQNLEKFEAECKLLDENMNLTKLAKILKTNIKYAARIILKHRGKKTVDYINDLKINYIITILKFQPRYRLYTTTALSEVAGFGSAQNFTRAFKSRTELTPMFFISQLQKAEKEQESK